MSLSINDELKWTWRLVEQYLKIRALFALCEASDRAVPLRVVHQVDVVAVFSGDRTVACHVVVVIVVGEMKQQVVTADRSNWNRHEARQAPIPLLHTDTRQYQYGRH